MKVKQLLNLALLFLPLLAKASVVIGDITDNVELSYDVQIGGLCYRISDNEAIVTFDNYEVGENEVAVETYYACPTYTGHIVIPETIEYKGKIYTICTIGPGAFGDCSDLTSIVIPNSVTSIDKHAFEGCI